MNTCQKDIQHCQLHAIYRIWIYFSTKLWFTFPHVSWKCKQAKNRNPLPEQLSLFQVFQFISWESIDLFHLVSEVTLMMQTNNGKSLLSKIIKSFRNYYRMNGRFNYSLLNSFLSLIKSKIVRFEYYDERNCTAKLATISHGLICWRSTIIYPWNLFSIHKP